MHASIHVHFSKELTAENLTSGLPRSADHATALAMTVFRDTPELRANATHSQITPSAVSILFIDGSKSAQLHVENTSGKGSITNLKTQAHKALRTLEDSAKAANSKCDQAEINIHSEGNLISIGRRRTRLKAIIARFRDTVVADLVLAVTLFITARLQGQSVLESLIVGVVAVITFLVWSGFEVGRGGQEYDYEDA